MLYEVITASMINTINEERDEVHLITVEDPIEYYHKHKKALVTQREIGVDVPNFAEALRCALRQDPDVVLVGEMRDLDRTTSYNVCYTKLLRCRNRPEK